MANKKRLLKRDAAREIPMKHARRAQAGSASAVTPPQCISLAGKTCDQVMELAEALNAYLAIECFVAPEHADEVHASVPPSRAQLTALLHAVNVEVQRKIGALADITTVLQAQVTIDAAQAR